MEKTVKLYIVATPIGNYDDITLRALKILKSVDFVICEERKEGSKLLKNYEIEKQLFLLNEHNEEENSEKLLMKMITEQKSAALISDAGTPLFADPGVELVKKAQLNNIQVVPIPGASSLMAALMVSGEKIAPFLYYGFLSANKFERRKELSNLKRKTSYNIIFLETPYRLEKVLKDMRKILGSNREAVIAYKLTQKEEKIFWGTLKELLIMTQNLPKGEFVILLKRIKRR